MPQTDAQKRATNKYQAAHYTIVGCKVRKDYAARFQAACFANGTKPATVLKAAIDSYLLNNEEPHDNATSAPAAVLDVTTS